MNFSFELYVGRVVHIPVEKLKNVEKRSCPEAGNPLKRIEITFARRF
jgi:hypothetical protein